MRPRLAQLLGILAIAVSAVSLALADSSGEVWWSFRPLGRPAVPDVRDAQFAVRNPIDAFVLTRLHPDGLRPAAEADRRVLIRRLSFDLIGLPPTPPEIAAFVADSAPEA